MASEQISDLMLAKLTDPEHLRPPMPALFRQVTVPTFARLLAERSFADDLTPAFMAQVLGDLGQVQSSVAAFEATQAGRHDEVMAALMQLAKQQGAQNRAYGEGVSEAQFVALAQRISDQVRDVQEAFAELERAVEIVVEGRNRLPLPDDPGGFVNAVLARVDGLNQQGHLDAGMTALQDALAAQKQLLDSALTQAVLTRDAAAAAALDAERLALAGADFDAYRALQDTWFQRGLHKGLGFDLDVSVRLAELSFAQARSWGDRGAALNDQAVALVTLGERERSTDRLDQAILVYEQALTEFTRDRVPLDWATTRHNHANALQTLAERCTDPALMRQAIAAYQDALQERTREAEPDRWAMTQNNLGNSLSTLGEMEADRVSLEAAIVALQAAMEVRTRKAAPFDWARSQNNLGACLTTLARLDTDAEVYRKAATAFEQALEVHTKADHPVDWGMARCNLCDALTQIGRLTDDAAVLQEAQAHGEAALAVFTDIHIQYFMQEAQGLLDGLKSVRDTEG